MKQVLADTSFFIRLSNKKDPLHNNALGYFKYFLNNDYHIRLSTIALSEYCVKGKAEELPIQHLLITPFNANHANISSQYHAHILSIKEQNGLNFSSRLIVPNDTKLFAQTNCEKANHYITADVESRKVFNALKSNFDLSFDFIDINIPPSQFFGLLDFQECDYEQDIPTHLTELNLPSCSKKK